MFEGPFRGSAAIAAGQLTRGALRGARFHRLFPDVYVAADVEADLAIRSRAAYLFAAGRGVVGGYSAAELLGAACAPPDAMAEVVVGHHVRPQPGLVVHRGHLEPSDVWTIGDCRVTSPLRTAWDLARSDDLVDAVVAIDALGAWGAFAPADLLTYRERHPAARAGRHLDRAVELAELLRFSGPGVRATPLRAVDVVARLRAHRLRHPGVARAS